MSTPNTARNFATRPFSDPDVIVIGSGMGGLTTAGILSMYGMKVMVLEQHDTPGGSMHHFKQGTEWVSAGWHYVGRPNKMFRSVWNYLTNNQPYTNDPDEIYDTNWGVGSMTGNTVENVMGIKLKDMRRVEGAFTFLLLVKLLPKPLAWIVWLVFRLTGKYREATMNYGEWCKKVTGEKVEKDIWWTQRGDHGVPRSKTCALLGVGVVAHYKNGVIHPQGGPRETVMRMVQTISNNGGCVLLKAPVRDILTENNKVVGVEVDGVRIPCMKVIVTGAEPIHRLMKDRAPKGIQEAMAELGPSVTHGAIFLTFTGKSRLDLDMPPGNIWYQERMFISTKESPTGTVVYILWEMPYVPRGAGYEEAKDNAATEAMNIAQELFPKIKHYNEFDAATPATTEFYLDAWNGCSYGLNAPTERFNSFRMVRNLRPKQDVEGLYLTGQDMMLAGVMGAMVAGVFCAQAVRYPGLSGIWNNVFKDLDRLLKKQKKGAKASA